jgi:hypothetical protein
MQQVIPIQTPRRADHPALRLLLLGLSASATLTGCVKKDDNPNCVSVGSGWRACSVDAATSVDSGTNEKCYPCELIGGTATGVCGAQ